VEDVSYFIHAAVGSRGAADQMGPVIDTSWIRVVGGGLYKPRPPLRHPPASACAYLVTRSRRRGRKPAWFWGGLIGRRRGARNLELAVDASLSWTRPAPTASTLQWIEYGALKGLPFLIL